MSLTERPRRPILSLPGYAPPVAPEASAPLPARASPRPRELVQYLCPVPPVQSPVEPAGGYDARQLSRPYHAKMIAELAGILGAPVPPVFAPRIPLPLCIGAHGELVARYAAVDQLALRKWLSRWTATQQYRMQLSVGGVRFDLDAAVSSEITADAVEHAREQLNRGTGR